MNDDNEKNQESEIPRALEMGSIRIEKTDKK